MDTRPDTHARPAVIEWRNNNDGRQAEMTALTAVQPGGPSLTVQAMAEEADLNVIMRRFASTGVLPQTTRIPTYDDFTAITDFRGALEAVREAEKNFMTLPAEIRSKFHNDPQRLLEWVADDRNIEEAEKLGMLVPRPKPTADVASGQAVPDAKPA